MSNFRADDDDPIDLHSDDQTPRLIKKVKLVHVDINPAPSKDDKAMDMDEVDLENGQHGVQDFDYDDDNAAIANLFIQHTVVKVMMSQMSIEDLKKCRVVSSIWNQVALTQLHKLAPLLKPKKFENANQVQDFTTLMRNSPTRKFVAYSTQVNLAAISSNEFEFLQVFEPKYLSIDIGEIYMDELIDFLQKCGKFVNFLIISGTLNIGGEMSWPGNLKFSQLEEIYLRFHSNKIAPLPQFIQDENYIFENLVKTSPKLKKLHFNIRPSEEHLEIILRQSGSGIVHNLQELNISVIAYESRVNIHNISETLFQMSCVGLRLRKFRIIFIGIHDDDTELQIQQICSFFNKLSQFLACQSATLESLKIDVGYVGNASYIQTMTTIDKFNIPRMPQLKVFELRNWSGLAGVLPASTLIFNQLNLPWCFPKLREIELDLLSLSDWEKVFSGASESVERIFVKNNRGNEDAEYLNLEKYFPNVKCLRVDNRRGNLCRKVFADFPWATTLTHLILELSTRDLNNLQIGFISYLTVLRKLELHKLDDFINNTLDENPNKNIDLESLSNITYLKIKNFQISSILESQIREKYILDYSPPIPCKISKLESKNDFQFKHF